MSETSERAENEEFYVGYLPEAPPDLARRTRRRTLCLAAGGLALAILLSALQGPVSRAVFEFGHVRSLEGWIVARPHPQLLVERPGEGAGFSRYPLVVYGKRGAQEAVSGLDGRRVRLEGSLIYADDQTMVEILPETVEPIDGAEPPRRGAGEEWTEDLGRQTFRGEIVDAKCFLGVMKPGNLKPHRACATRCISGGVPPVLLIRGAEGHANYLWLASPDGGTVNGAVLDMVAEPVEMTGRLVRYDNLLVLFADPQTYERLD